MPRSTGVVFEWGCDVSSAAHTSLPEPTTLSVRSRCKCGALTVEGLPLRAKCGSCKQWVKGYRRVIILD